MLHAAAPPFTPRRLQATTPAFTPRLPSDQAKLNEHLTQQAMLKSLYDHFVVLYQNVSPPQPGLAAEHALRQEQELYDASGKFVYRNVRPLANLQSIHGV
jgi:RNA exonuclease 1